MSQRYKEYDKKYRQYEGTALARIKQFDNTVVHDAATVRIVRWKLDLFPYITNYYREMIAGAVYNSDTSEAWQLFRVSLKGLTTQEKLYCLRWRYERADEDKREIEQVRINNYLGALIRGGFLSRELEVVK